MSVFGYLLVFTNRFTVHRPKKKRRDMEASHPRSNRGRGIIHFGDSSSLPKRPNSKNRQWVADHGGGPRSNTTTPAPTDGERWVRGGGPRPLTGKGRAEVRATHTSSRSSPRVPLMEVLADADEQEEEHTDVEETYPVDDPDPETPEERERFYQEVRFSFFAFNERDLPFYIFCKQVGESTRGRTQEGYRRRENGRSTSRKTLGGRDYHGWNVYGYVSPIRTVSPRTRK